MDTAKQRKLEAAGWRVGSTADFLNLTPEEAAYIAFKLSLSRDLRTLRSRKNVTQAELATKIGSSLSCAAKADAGNPSVSTDLLVKALFARGALPADPAHLISPSASQEAL